MYIYDYAQYQKTVDYNTKIHKMVALFVFQANKNEKRIFSKTCYIEENCFDEVRLGAPKPECPKWWQGCSVSSFGNWIRGHQHCFILLKALLYENHS